MVTRYEVRDGLLYGRPAKRVDVYCAHGGSSFLILPGNAPRANAAAVDLLASAHGIRRSCQCAELPTEDSALPRLGAPARTSTTTSPMP